MNRGDDQQYAKLPSEQMLQIDRLCSRFETAWRSGEKPRVEVLLKELPVSLRRAALTELLPLEIEYRQLDGTSPTLDELTSRFPKINVAWLGQQLKSLMPQTEFGNPSTDTQNAPIPESLGDYRILGQLGSGGMGTVYRAEHQRMGRQVALKVLRPEIQNNADLLKRFDREVRAAARLTHANIVAALDAREFEGQHFLVTELVEGADLEQTVRHHGPLPVKKAIDCVLQAARGLAYAHSQGVIHRDIKPANLLLATDGTVKILDMGLARLDAIDEPAATQLTKTGVVMGTAAYMPPEQARDTRRADARSDIYSLGCTLFFLLTGRTAFAGATQVDMILSHVNEPIPSLKKANSNVPFELDALFQKIVAKQPGDRIQSATEVVSQLEEIVAEMANPGLQRTAVDVSIDLSMLVGDQSASPKNIGWPAGEDVSQSGNQSEAALKPTARPVNSGAVNANRQRSAKQRRRTGKSIWIAATALAVVAIVVIAAVKIGDDEDLQPNGGEESVTLNNTNHGPPDTTPVGQTEHYALRFNGTSSFASVPGLVPEAGQQYTVEAIVKPEFLKLADIVAWMGPEWMALYIDNGGHIGAARRVGDRSVLVQADEPVAMNQWFHMAATFDGDQLNIFVDGQLMTTSPVTFTIPETSGGLFIGGFDSSRVPDDQSDRFFPGQVAGIRISTGVRYKNSFEIPKRLAPDATTIASFLFNGGPESRSVGYASNGQNWQIQITDATWQPLSRPEQQLP